MELFFPLRVEEKKHENLGFFWEAERIGAMNSNLILGVIFPPKNGVRLKRYQLLQSSKKKYEELCCDSERGGATRSDSELPETTLFYAGSDPTLRIREPRWRTFSKAKLPQIIILLYYYIILYYIIL